MKPKNVDDRLAATQLILVVVFAIALHGALKPTESSVMARVARLERQMQTVPDAALLLFDAMPRGAVDLDPHSPVNRRLIEYLAPRKLTDPCIVDLAEHVAKVRKVARMEARGATGAEMAKAYDLFKECLKNADQ